MVAKNSSKRNRPTRIIKKKSVILNMLRTNINRKLGNKRNDLHLLGERS